MSQVITVVVMTVLVITKLTVLKFNSITIFNIEHIAFESLDVPICMEGKKENSVKFEFF